MELVEIFQNDSKEEVNFIQSQSHIAIPYATIMGVCIGWGTFGNLLVITAVWNTKVSAFIRLKLPFLFIN